MENALEEIPRHEPENPFKYSKLQLAERLKALKDLERDYPRVPYAHLELVYDFVRNTPPEEVNKIIESGIWEKPPPKTPEEKQELIEQAKARLQARDKKAE